LGFGHFVMGHEAFRSGNFNTRFIENYFKPEYLKGDINEDEELLAAAFAVTVSNSTLPKISSETQMTHKESKWRKNRL
ncbi:MAG: biotin carboxylase, partial [Cyclobacteriaceae bacterium]